MPDLTEEEKKILRQAYEIKERIKAEELEAGEVSVDEAVDEDLSTDKPIQRQRKQTRPKPKPNTVNETSPVDERSIYGPEASNEVIKKATITIIVIFSIKSAKILLITFRHP